MKIAYTLIRTKRKSLLLQVTDGLEVVVRAPVKMPKERIDSFVEAHESWLAGSIEKQRRRAERYPEPGAIEIKRLKELAGRELPLLAESYAAVMGLKYAGIKITSAKKRFGSCNGKNSLCFSYLLMRYPRPAIEYVVVHELAHIVHKNHGRDFYRLIESVLPDYKQRAKLLKHI